MTGNDEERQRRFIKKRRAGELATCEEMEHWLDHDRDSCSVSSYFDQSHLGGWKQENSLDVSQPLCFCVPVIFNITWCAGMLFTFIYPHFLKASLLVCSTSMFDSLYASTEPLVSTYSSWQKHSFMKTISVEFRG